MLSYGSCPFCGGDPAVRRPYLSGMSFGGQVAGTGASIDMGGSGESYLRCNGCTREYVPAGRDIETILAGLRVDKSIPRLIRHYHNEAVPVTDLLTAHRTAIVRGVNHYRSYRSVSASKYLLICFRYRRIRTFGRFVRKEATRASGDHYEFRELSKA